MAGTGEGSKGAGVYLIVLREVLIANDITMVIHDAVPGVRVIAVMDLDDAAKQVMPDDHVSVAFLAVDPAIAMQSALVQELAGQGTRIVIVGHDEHPALTRAMGWSVLVYPFNGDDVQHHLAVAHQPGRSAKRQRGR